ncbi:hypothetical protein ACXVUM_03570 [Williamsia sp. SKLECPSW1]
MPQRLHTRGRARVFAAAAGPVIAMGILAAPASAAPYPPVPVTSSPQGPAVGAASPVNPGSAGIAPGLRTPGAAGLAPGAFPVQAQTGAPPAESGSEAAPLVWSVSGGALVLLCAAAAIVWRRRIH